MVRHKDLLGDYEYFLPSSSVSPVLNACLRNFFKMADGVPAEFFRTRRVIAEFLCNYNFSPEKQNRIPAVLSRSSTFISNSISSLKIPIWY